MLAYDNEIVDFMVEEKYNKSNIDQDDLTLTKIASNFKQERSHDCYQTSSQDWYNG